MFWFDPCKAGEAPVEPFSSKMRNIFVAVRQEPCPPLRSIIQLDYFSSISLYTATF
jgi:hypothetical protein